MKKFRVVILEQNGTEIEKDFRHLSVAKHYAFKNKNSNNIVDVVRISDQSVWFSL